MADGPETGQLKVKVIDTATGKSALCRVNVIGADGNYYQPADNPLTPFSLTGTWPETLAGNRPTKAPIRYFGHFFYTSGDFTVDRSCRRGANRSLERYRVSPGHARNENRRGRRARPASKHYSPR